MPAPVDGIEIAYRWRRGRWTAALSNGEPLEVAESAAGFHEARAEIRSRMAARLAVSVEELDRHIAAEHLQPPEWASVEWHGLRFAMLVPDYGVDDPSAEQRALLRACFEYYRDNVPEGMKVEYYANRVRVEPGAFGQRRAVIDAIGGALAAQVPDEWTMTTGPVSCGLDQAREQFRRALLLDVPEGFVRVTTSFEGFEDEGTLGTLHLLLKERWELDRPF
ncbi:MAG: hypothetical protein ACT4QG_05470 [Sporichthyaceae bacterium]